MKNKYTASITIILATILFVLFVPLTNAMETESGTFIWKFCNDEKQFSYKIINGTLHDTAHLKLHGTDNCGNNKNTTDYQIQLFHTSNNQTDFTLFVPDDLEFDKIDVNVVGRGYLEYFELNNTSSSMEFSDFTHDINGFVTIILDFKGIEN